MYLRAVSIQAVWRFGCVNVPACVRTGLRTLLTLYAPGRACEQGPGRFGHVNVDGAGGLGGPAGRGQSVTAANTNQCDQHSAPVRKRYRAPWSQSWRAGLRSDVGPLRVEESIRLTGAGAQWLALPAVPTTDFCRRARACPRCLAVWPLHSLGVWPYGLWSLAVWPLDSRRMALPHFTR